MDRLHSPKPRLAACGPAEPPAGDGDDASHPALWLVLALLGALLGTAVSLSRGADEEPELVIATEAPSLVDAWLAPDAMAGDPAAMPPRPASPRASTQR